MPKILIYKFEEWLKNRSLSKNTIQQYLYYYIKYGNSPINQVFFTKFISKVNNSVSKSFLRNLKEFIIVNYKELGFSKEDIIDINLIVIPKFAGRKAKEIKEVLSIDDISKIEQQLLSEELKLMLLISFYGALRVSEVLKIRIKSFNWNEWKLNQSKPIELKIKGKGNKDRIIYISNKIAERLGNFIEGNLRRYKKTDYLIFNNKDTEFETIKSKSTIWGKILKKAGKDAGLTIDVHPHLLRHSFTTYLLHKEKPLPIEKVQLFLGHSNITSTQRYVHIDQKELKEDFENLYSYLYS